LANARPAQTTTPAAQGSNGAQKLPDPRALAEKASATSAEKPPSKVDDPFADLDSLEAEMARLLGREKLD